MCPYGRLILDMIGLLPYRVRTLGLTLYMAMNFSLILNLAAMLSSTASCELSALRLILQVLQANGSPTFDARSIVNVRSLHIYMSILQSSIS
jgi:hypothetical protein